MPPERWEDRIEDILISIAKIQQYMAGLSFDTFVRDDKTVDAVLRNLSIIGEAARHIPPEVQARAPMIPWTDIRGMRHHVVHAYRQVDLQIVWKTIEERLPPLVIQLQDLLRG